MTGTTINLRGGWDDLMAEHMGSCQRIHPVSDVSDDCFNRFRRLLTKVTYRDWTMLVNESKGQALIQVHTVMPDAVDGKPIENNGRPLPLCPEMSDGFVIDLAFELLKEFELHEVAERFKIDGTRYYYPHNTSGRPVREVRSMRSMPSVEEGLRLRRLHLETALAGRYQSDSM